MNRNIATLNYIIYLSLLFYLFVDSVTGFLLRTSGGSLSIPYKTFILICMIIVILHYSAKKILLIMSLLAWFSCISISTMLLNPLQLFLVIQTGVKSVAIPIFFLYFYLCKKNEKRIIYYVKNIIITNTIIFLMNMFLGLLGIGYSTYQSTGSGIVGFLFAGNEVSLILLSIAMLYMQSHSKRNRVIIYIFYLILALMLGTKAGILGLLIIIVADFYMKFSVPKKIIFISMIPILVISLFYIYSNFLSSLPTVERIVWAFNRNYEDSGSILDALLSSRLQFLENNINLWKEKFNFFNFFLGGGDLYENKSIEIDFFDSVVLLGVPHSVFLLMFYFKLVFGAIRQKNWILVVFNITVLGMSFTSGHIWWNLTGGLFFIIANVYFEALRKKTKYSGKRLNREVMAGIVEDIK